MKGVIEARIVVWLGGDPTLHTAYSAAAQSGDTVCLWSAVYSSVKKEMATATRFGDGTAFSFVLASDLRADAEFAEFVISGATSTPVVFTGGHVSLGASNADSIPGRHGAPSCMSSAVAIAK